MKQEEQTNQNPIDQWQERSEEQTDPDQINRQKAEREEQRRQIKSKGFAGDLAKSAIFVVLMVVAAFIQIPFFPVPLTFQTVVAILAGLLLGAKYGTISIAVYVFMGLLGLPVFTNGGGFAYVLQLTFGYLLGFVAAAFVAGLIAGRGRPSFLRMVIAAVAGFFINYCIGLPYFILIWTVYMQNGGVVGILITGNLLYMPKDFVLSLLAACLAWKVLPVIGNTERKRGVEKK